MRTLIVTLLLLSTASPSAAESIKKLIETGKVKVLLRSTGGHQESCIEIKMKNMTASPVIVDVEPGRRLEAATDSADQDLLIVKDQTIRLAAGETFLGKIFAFCCQKKDRSPAKGHAFKVGVMASAALVKLAQFISTNNFSSDAVQNSIWVLSDKHNLSSVHEGSQQENADLRRLTAELAGIEMPWYYISYKSVPGMVFSDKASTLSGKIDYKLSTNTSVTIIVKNTNGMLIRTLLENKPQQPGKQNVPISFPVAGLSKGKYQILVLDDNTNIIHSREFEL
ncbi:MAG: hypothetical protein FJ347_05700 [Sphingomonadales bacterium]|nr:hypothetical protein [Sphingomonadales bacterium]